MAIKNNRIKYVLAICMFFLVSSFLNCGLSNQINAQESKINVLGIRSIRDDSLKSFVRNFETAQFPFNLTYVPQESEQKEQIEENHVKKYIKSENHLDGIINRYCYGFVFFSERYLLLITSFHQTQGLSSMEDWHLRIHSFSYGGTFISTKDIACHCNSFRLGRNEYYATTFDGVVLSNSLIVNYEIKKRGSILPDEEENFFEEIARDTIGFFIDKQGEIDKSNEVFI